MDSSPWRTVASKHAHENRWFRVRTDEVITPSGEAGEYNVIEVPAAVTIVALNDDDEFCLIREYRYAHQLWMWETPVGSLDPGEADPLTAAQRELREETGLTSDDWTYVGLTRGLKGISNQVLHVFLARSVTAGRTDRKGIEAIDQQRFISLADFFDELRTGHITDGETVAAVALVVAHLRLLESPPNSC